VSLLYLRFFVEIKCPSANQSNAAVLNKCKGGACVTYHRSKHHARGVVGELSFATNLHLLARYGTRHCGDGGGCGSISNKSKP